MPRINQTRRVAKQHAASISELCVGTAEKNRRFPIRVIEHLQTKKNIPEMRYRAFDDDPDLDTVVFPLDALRGDPRFERLVAKVIGIAENESLAQPIESKSIAVLPFENLSSEPETAYFADGIQEEILTRLSKIRDLKIISRTSTQR